MKRMTIVSTTLAAGLIGAVLAVSPAITASNGLKPAAEFTAIKDDAKRATAIFEEMAKVITHPRCLNCHPRDDSPRQGENQALHNPPVTRADEAGMGAPGMRCTTCHTSKNVAFIGAEGSVPGHDIWHLPPKSMGWIGLSVGEICEQLKDPKRNGDRTLADIHEHNAKDGLVGWAWNPGQGREPAPGTQAQFGELTKAWIDAGGHCPKG